MRSSPLLPFVRCCVLAFMTAGLTGLAEAQEKVDFAKHPFFKLLIGDWEAAGDLQGQEGNVVKIKETWKGSVLSEGSFSIEGKRDINGNESAYRWNITYNPATASYEVTHHTGSGGESQRFEGSISDVTMTMELSAQLGGGSMVKLVDSFVGEGHDILETQVTLTNDKGETTLSGKVTNKRVKKA